MEVVKASDELLAFHINGSEGTKRYHYQGKRKRNTCQSY